MKKQTIYLTSGIMALLVFIGFLGETENQNLLGYDINIWVYRLAWLLLTVVFFRTYFKLKKEAQ